MEDSKILDIIHSEKENELNDNILKLYDKINEKFRIYDKYFNDLANIINQQSNLLTNMASKLDLIDKECKDTAIGLYNIDSGIESINSDINEKLSNFENQLSNIDNNITQLFYKINIESSNY